MSEREKNQRSVHVDPPREAGVRRRDFLLYLSALASVATLPEALEACAVPTSPELASTAVDLSALPAINWVTRKTDGLYLGFQFANLVRSANGTLVLASGASAASAYVIVTFPPQHVIEDAFVPAQSVPSPVRSYASGTSQLVFQVPSDYGAASDPPVPYTVAGILGLCARSTTVVAPNALSTAAYSAAQTSNLAPAARAGAAALSQARIDRTLARYDAAASERVMARLGPARARDVQRDTATVATTPGTAPVKPVAGQTSIELPHRLLLSPNETVAWSHPAAPVTSSSGRTELWQTSLGKRNPTTGLADPSLGGLTARALWTRDSDGTPADPVQNPLPSATNRKSIVRDSGDFTNPNVQAIPVGRLSLSPLGGTLDLAATFPDPSLLAWIQRTVLGRDEFVEVVSTGTLLPFGHSATLVQMNKRNADPNAGAVGTLLSINYLVIGTPVVSFATPAAPSDFYTCPFVGAELLTTRIAVSTAGTTGIGPSQPNWLSDPTGATVLAVGATGTDYRGRTVGFQTPLYYIPAGGSLASAIQAWNDGPPSAIGVPALSLGRQRIAYAPPTPSDPSATTTTTQDTTSYETVSFNLALKASSNGLAPVPVAQTLHLAVEAVRHLTTSTSAGTTPNAEAIFDYDTTRYATSGFSANNPHEIFLSLTGPAPGQTTTPSFSFSSDASTSGGLVAPDMVIAALSRAHGVVSGTKTSSALFDGGFNPTDFFNGALPKLFGFVDLKAILQTLASDAQQYLPKFVAQDVALAEQFIERALALYQQVQTAYAQVQQLVAQAQSDAAIAQAYIASGKSAAGTLLTQAETTALSEAAATATEAEAILQSYVSALENILTDATTVGNDVAQGNWTKLVSLGAGQDGGASGEVTGDLPTLLDATQAFLDQIPLPAGQAAASYVGGVANDLSQAVTAVSSFLSAAAGAAETVTEVVSALMADLTALSQGLDLAKEMVVEMTWRPKIQGVSVGGVLAFQPATDQALQLDVTARAKAIAGNPAGVSVTCRLDQFAIGFGNVGNLTTNADDAGLAQIIDQADVSLVFDHMQVQLLAGEKPDVDLVFKGVNFGGELKFIETLKDLLPLDGFSDPPYVDVDASGITAGFDLTVPNVAIGMFSLENIKIAAALTVPFLSSDGLNGVTFEFDFCTKDNPFLVTVAMLGGGGWFNLTMDMTGIAEITAGIEVCAQLAADLGIVSGSISIEVGIYFDYTAANGVAISGYLRLRGEVDVCGVITISIELYLQISYADGKVTASGYLAIDVHLFFFSIDARILFSRTFAGSNGDPTFAQLMAPDPTLMDPFTGAEWNPFVDYCMALA